MYPFYGIAYTAFMLFGLPYFLYRSLGTGRYTASLQERLGRLPPDLVRDDRPSVWIHAVSVGEVVAAGTLIPLLRRAFPTHRVLVSVTTVTGRHVAERQLQDVDGIFYSPFDWRFAVRRVVARLRPRVLILMETEIWPRLLRTCHQAGAATLIANGRISDRSYPRYRLIRPFLRRFLREVDHFCMQSSLYAERIVALGAEPDRVEVTGSIKFDAVPAGGGELSKAVHLIPEQRRVLVAGSTLAPEEEIVLETFTALRDRHSELFLIIAPRHPERFGEVVELASSHGLRVVRRSDLARPPADADVMVLDTLGELSTLYAAADLVFVGGSLAPWGGHNIIEPAAHGKPIVFGPHMDNFREIATLFLEGAAAVRVEDPAELRAALEELLMDSVKRKALGERALRLVEANRGAGQRTVEAVLEALKGRE